ncbi:helix-turn-helix domain-containing protein [Kribbella sp. NPDC050820]|uniref:TetR/AcrR family transcriptional regulator n=1 Tax=Kribbella sp. NPDC050820 TaxID=3155408 RepID=UPI0033D6CBF6
MRLTAVERRAEVLQAAVQAFAASGYAATTTAEIARLADVSQPYVIRLFGTKQQLFLAVLQSVSDRIEQTLRDTAGQEPTPNSLDRCCERFPAEVLLIPLHGFSATNAEPAIGEAVRDRFGRIYQLIRQLTGTSPAEASDVLRAGVLLTGIIAASPRPWQLRRATAGPGGRRRHRQ